MGAPTGSELGVDEGAITATERNRMALKMWAPRRSDLVAPFAEDGRFQSLVLKGSETCTRDSAWDALEADADAGALAVKHAIVLPLGFHSHAGVVSRQGTLDPGACVAFADRLTNGLKRRLAASPATMHSLVQTVVVAKRGNGHPSGEV